MSKLLKLYTEILSYAGMAPNEKDEVMITLLGEEAPAMIDGKRLVMPTRDILKTTDPEKDIVFHPFQEFVNRGESSIVRKMRKAINIRLNLAVAELAPNLFKIMSNPAMHQRFTPQQREILRVVTESKIDTGPKFSEFTQQFFSTELDRIYVNIYLKKSGKIADKVHSRVGVVSFPGFERFAEKDKPKKFTNAEWAAFRSMLQFIFPGAEENAESYYGYSDSHDFPWLECLLRTAVAMSSRLNELYAVYREFFPDDAEILTLPFNEDWVSKLDNVDDYRDEIRLIPSQRGNEGEVEAAAPKAASGIVQSALQDKPAEATQAQKKEVWDQASRLAPSEPMVAAQPVGPTMVPVQTPSGVVMMPLAQVAPTPAPAPQPATPASTGKGLDFRKIVESNPMLANTGPMNSAVFQQQMQSDPMLMQRLMFEQYLRSQQPISPGLPGSQPVMAGNPGGWGMMAPAPTYNPIWGNNVRPATPEEIHQERLRNWQFGNAGVSPWGI